MARKTSLSEHVLTNPALVLIIRAISQNMLRCRHLLFLLFVTFSGLICRSGDFQYIPGYTQGSVQVSGYVGTNENVVIPNTIDGLAVTGITSAARFGLGVRTVTLPNSLQFFPYSWSGTVFEHSPNLQAIYVEEGSSYLSSRDGVLYNQSQNYLYACPPAQNGDFVIPPTVTSVVAGAFKNCVNLRSVTIPGSVQFIEDDAFRNCRGLTNVILQDGVRQIGSCFTYCSSLGSLSFPASVTSIGSFAFQGCVNFSEISVAPENQFYSVIDGMLCDKAGSKILFCPTGLKQGAVIIPSSVSEIGDRAFRDCVGITSIDLHAVRTIGESAFYGCSSLQTVTLGKNVSSLGWSAFWNCGLKSVTFPTSLVVVPNSVFMGCAALTNVVLHDRILSIDTYAFAGCSALTAISLPQSLSTIGPRAFQDCASISQINFGTNVQSFSANVFDGCLALQAINVDARNQKLSTIGGVLYNKAGTALLRYPPGKIGAVIFPEGMIGFDDSTLQTCVGITNVLIPKSMTSVPRYAFLGCTNLASIGVADGNPTYKSVDGVLVANTQDLTAFPPGRGGSYTIPSSITALDLTSFMGCVWLTNVTIPGPIYNFLADSFRDCSRLVSFTVDPPSDIFSAPDGVLFARKTLMRYPPGRSGAYTIPEGTTDIFPHAFEQVPGLTSVVIASTVTNIGDFGLQNNPNLKAVLFKGSPPNGANGNIPPTTQLYYAAGAPNWDFSVRDLYPIEWRPAIRSSGSADTSSHRFTLVADVPGEFDVVAEATDDLQSGSWIPVPPDPNSALSFQDDNASPRQRFYRLRLP